ncbi:MAG: hypothetical protein DI569_09345 [Sphingopyxis macrogoltabida]|uniref:DUF2846 domain-containing protein n=1 Tax=Sphingopyxis macrogoltabida TaxID=33050 RepID=A0A2W5KYP6_SPHMC|nr:MAG: hypothetical protein DI569_09345 [Sphingopyxis macrogoltabida]
MMMSKNAMWLTIIFAAAILGALMGPLLANNLSFGTLILLTLVVFGGIIAYCVWALSKNKGGAKADTAALADARTMMAPEGKARIYVTRRGFVGALQGMNIGLDGQAQGQIKSGQMLMADVAPGTHRIDATTAQAKLARPAEIEVDVAAGAVVAIDAMLEMGALKGGVKLTRSDAAKTREDVNATTLILWTVPPA